MTRDIHAYIGGLRQKQKRRVVGLMSGTSADGVSAAVTEITGFGLRTRLKVLSFKNFPFPSPLRDAVFKLFVPETSNVDGICQMNFVLGEFFAECVLRLVEESGFSLDSIDLMGSHGQTIYHSPSSAEICGYDSKSTLQIGEPTVIAQRTGIPTVADFRKADISAGGEGAPLMPYFDYILHRDEEHNRVFQNIGGIANLTYLPSGCSADEVIAFDTGPGNMLIDAVVKNLTSGRLTYDEGGRLAATGTVSKELLKELLSHPYFSRSPPKTTGREIFGDAFAAEFLSKAEKLGLKLEDAAATATALTVESIAGAYEDFLPIGGIDAIYVSGGGSRNYFMINSLRTRLHPIPISEYDQLGILSEAKEAALMAVLANEYIFSNPSNLPKATGAKQAVVLGQLCI